MRSLSSEVVQKLQSGELTSFLLFAFSDGNNWYRYTNLDVPIYYADDSTTAVKWTPLGFQVEAVMYSMSNIVNSSTIIIDNLNSVMSALFVGSTLQDNDAKLLYGIMDTKYSILDVVTVFIGTIDEWELNERQLTLAISSPFARWNDKAYEKHSSSCRYRRFKGPRCKYSGSETTCNRSVSTCINYGNYENFGGFKHLPTLMNTTIWWGPTPQERKAEG